MTKRTKLTSLSAARLSTLEHRNWGYWDGVAARERGYRWPAWSNGRSGRSTHPCDKPYGEGFWMGWYNEPHPNAETLASVAPK